MALAWRGAAWRGRHLDHMADLMDDAFALAHSHSKSFLPFLLFSLANASQKMVESLYDVEIQTLWLARTGHCERISVSMATALIDGWIFLHRCPPPQFIMGCWVKYAEVGGDDGSKRGALCQTKACLLALCCSHCNLKGKGYNISPRFMDRTGVSHLVGQQTGHGTSGWTGGWMDG